MQADALVELLYRGRRDGLAGLDLTSSGLTRDRALELQLAVADRFAYAGDPVGGWKVARTSGPQRDQTGFRPFGFVRSSMVFPSGASVPFAQFEAGVTIELELCICRDDAGQVMGVAPSFELVERRAASCADDETVIADASANWGIVVGKIHSLPRTPLRELGGRLYTADRLVGSCTPGETMDDPLESVAHLDGLLARFGRSAYPGRYVITGAIVKEPVTGPGSWRGEFAGLSDVQVEFT
jgi:2-keto-4-pentenoate hydratase